MVAVVDHRGRPFRQRDLAREVAAPTAGGVRSIHSGHPATGLTPERLASILREAETPGGAEPYLELAEQMEELHPHYLGVLQTRRSQISQLPVDVEPASDSAADAAIAEEVRQWFARESWEDEAYDVLDAVGKGFSCSEIVWERSERQWMPARLLHRLPQHFDFDQTTGSILQMRGDDGAWTDLPPFKFLVHRVSAKSGLPIRGGIARIAAWTWMFAVFGLRDWMRYAEAFGMPLRIGKYHRAATREEIDILARAVRDIAADAAAVLPEEMMIEFVKAGDGGSSSSGQSIYQEIQRHLDSQLSIAVLGQTLTTEPGSSGSYALGQVHDRVRRDIARSDGRQLAATLRRDLVRPMVQLNHGPVEPPTLRIEPRDATDLDLLTRAVGRLVPYGFRVRAEDLRSRLGLAAPEDGDELLEPPDPAMAGRDGRKRLRDDRDAIELAVAKALDDWRPLAEPAVRPLLDAAEKAAAAGGDLDSFRASLPALLADVDDAPLAGLLERLAFSARLSGRADPADGDGQP